MSRLAAIIEAEALGQAPSPIPEPPSPAGTWPNGYAWRADYRIDSGLVDGDLANALVDLAVPVGALLEEADAADIRLEAGGAAIPYQLLRHDDAGNVAYLRARVPLIAAASDTIISAYLGKAGASGEENVAGVYAGLLLAIDGATGEDLTGQGRDGTPSGVTAGTMADGRPCGVYDGEAIISSAAVVDWIAGRDALSIVADLDADAAMDDANAVVWTQSAATDGRTNGSDTAKLTRLGVTSGGVPDVWNAAVRTTLALNAYVLGAADTASAGSAIVASTWAQGGAPDVYVDGALQLSSVAVARDAPIQYLSGGWHIGTGFVGKIAEVLVSPEALSPLWLDIDRRSKRAPLSLWGTSAWYEVDDVAPCIAMPVRAVATGGGTVSIDVLASAIGSGVTLESVTAGPRGAVEIVGGEASYTATGSAAGVDWFTFVIEDSGGRQSTGRCDITISAAVEPEPGEDALQLPTALSTVTTSVGNLAAAAEAAPTGRHILCPAGSYGDLVVTVNGGTNEDPVIIRPATAGAAVTIGRIIKEGTGVLQVWGCTITQPAGDGAGARLVRVNDTGGKSFLLAYCRLNVRGIGLEANGFNAVGCRTHRCHFVKVDIGSTANGQEAIKFGTNGTYRTDLGCQADHCLFEGFNAEREWFKMSAAGCRLYRCHATNCRDASMRNAWDCIIEECRFEGSGSLGRVTVWGPDHIVRNVICSTLYICPGTVDGDAIVDGTGGLYRSAKRTLLQQVSASSIIVGTGPFATGSIAPVGITGSDLSPSPTGPVSVGPAGAVPAVAPPTLTSSDVGPTAYASMVTGA